MRYPRGMTSRITLALALLLGLSLGCGDEPVEPTDAGSAEMDAGTNEDAATDRDAGAGEDAGTLVDAGPEDAGVDAYYETDPSAPIAPAFRAQDQTGAVRTLEEFSGQFVVLYFYPRDETPGCTTEACAFRDVWDRYEAANIQVLGVSTDSVESHAMFAENHMLPFPLLADEDETVAAAYEVPVGATGAARRMTFIIDPAGRIRHVYERVDVGVHAEEILELIATL